MKKSGLNNNKKRLTDNFSIENHLIKRLIHNPFLLVLASLFLYLALDIFSYLMLYEKESINIKFALLNLAFAFSCSYFSLIFLLNFDKKLSIIGFFLFILIFILCSSLIYAKVFILLEIQPGPFKRHLIHGILRTYQFTIFGVFIWLVLKVIYGSFEKMKIKLEYKQLQINHYSLQLNPHFLFNTLLSLNHQIRKHSLDLHTQIVEFAHFLRYGFKNIEEENTLQEEVHALKSYIECQRLRFEEALALEFDVDLDNTLSSSLHFPKMILLTITENIFKHGDYKDQNNPVKIAGKLIENSGVITFHFSSQNNTKKRNFIEQNKTGLSTIEDILAYHFKDGYSLQYQKLNNQFHLNLQVNYDQRI
ncbi:Histidine kinase [Belliella buryatensis]|uniref:Histidine kinase n=1 Tax=Belliella buryatensis TaxID=1500549 RepID=A0A239H0I4_9BACT|nr:sensor histidine kinase [Belliella buryatensis]SNS74692.1 Histidine kinase [Belliella buryatensis]